MALDKDADAPMEEATAKAEVVEQPKDKVEETTAAKPAAPEKPQELEEDSPADPRPKVKPGQVAFNVEDTTLNVMPTADGKVLMVLQEGGLQHLLAGARANAGVRSGRYVFEARMVETLSPEVSKAPASARSLRVGVSLGGSSLLLGDGQDSVFFDSDGFFVHGASRKKVVLTGKVLPSTTVALLLNLDAKSANANTVSLFYNGIRVSQPQPLPESFVGKALFPSVTYKGCTVHVNLGPMLRCKLPFASRTVGDAAAADLELKPSAIVGKPQVVFPVGLPGTGYFDWVDGFLAKNPGFTELSDRPKSEASIDKSELADDRTVQRVLHAIAPALRRNFVVPELVGNLIVAQRAKSLDQFSGAAFHLKAVVVVGEPNAEYRSLVRSLLLADKQLKLESAKKLKEADRQRKRLIDEKRKKMEEARKAAQNKKEGKDPAPEETKAEDIPVEEEPEVEATLTEEESKLLCRPGPVPDVCEKALAKAFSDFTLPNSEEGFHEVSYEWQPREVAMAHLKAWVQSRKLTERIEDLKPGAWFMEEWTKWGRQIAEWKQRQMNWKDPSKRRILLSKKAEEAKKQEQEGGAVEAPMDVNAEDLDVFAVGDVMDIGNGEPLFVNFAYEDWALLTVRCELHLLLHSFKKDLNDPERPSFAEGHLPFYYQKYMRRVWNLRSFGADKLSNLIDKIKDTVSIGDNGLLSAELAEDTPTSNLLKVTEEDRRDRQRRIDAGDETAKLLFPRTAQVPVPQATPKAAGPLTPKAPIATPKQPSAAVPQAFAGRSLIPPARVPAAGAGDFANRGLKRVLPSSAGQPPLAMRPRTTYAASSYSGK